MFAGFFFLGFRGLEGQGFEGVSVSRKKRYPILLLLLPQ